ncbi:MAG: hypothetical protein LBM69_02420 [Lachnospiraceae bacterium]|jgi:hypothetical protein|nr:hypothetical protein [Lachnospiraceae bacterium]
MNVNGITSNQAPAVEAYAKGKEKESPAANASTTQSSVAESAAVYEPSNKSVDTKTIAANPTLVKKMKADLNSKNEQLRGIVEKMMSQQANAYGQANDIWKFLASGNYTVDAKTKLQAQQDIAEDGYWGVEQTSDRIVDFAKALAGDDPEKLEEMKNAFLKGFKQATKAWGSDLPDISQRTYDAVMKKFDELTGSEDSSLDLSTEAVPE